MTKKIFFEARSATVCEMRSCLNLSAPTNTAVVRWGEMAAVQQTEKQHTAGRLSSFGRFVLYPFSKKDIIAWWYKKGTLKLKRRGRRCSPDMQSIHTRPESSSGQLPSAASSVDRPRQERLGNTLLKWWCVQTRGGPYVCVRVCESVEGEWCLPREIMVKWRAARLRWRPLPTSAV